MQRHRRATSCAASGSFQAMTTIDHAGPLAASGRGALTDDRVARCALQVARRTALGVLGDREAADDVAQDVAITAVRRAGSLRDPAALDAWLHRTTLRRPRRLRTSRAHSARPGRPRSGWWSAPRSS
jgi:DNA-directed RNA polymerase specialized sigma24 family protein